MTSQLRIFVALLVFVVNSACSGSPTSPTLTGPPVVAVSPALTPNTGMSLGTIVEFRLDPGGAGGGVAVPSLAYPGALEVQVRLFQPGTFPMELAVRNSANVEMSSVVAEITGNGSISLSHDGSPGVVIVRNRGTVSVTGSATFRYVGE